MEIIEVVANITVGAADGLSGKNKKTGKVFWIITILLVIGLFLFTLIMSQ